MAKVAGAKKAAVRDWECRECGKRMTMKQAQKAVSGTEGCPKCGGADIDLATTP